MGLVLRYSPPVDLKLLRTRIHLLLEFSQPPFVNAFRCFCQSWALSSASQLRDRNVEYKKIKTDQVRNRPTHPSQAHHQ